MIGILILFLVPALLAFVVALIVRRGHGIIAILVGSFPAALLAAANTETLADPMTVLFVAMFLVPSLLGAIAGAALARSLAARLAARRAARPEPGSAET